MQQVHGSSAQPQAVDAIWGLFEVGHHATGGHGSTQLQLRPRVRFPPVLQLGDGAGVSKLLQVWRKEMWSDTEKNKKTKIDLTVKQFDYFTCSNVSFSKLLLLLLNRR